MFDVVHAAGGYTAWADKHPVYEIVMGPAGHGVDDLYTPEIGNNFRGPADTTADKTTASVERTAAYDRFKAQAVLHQIAGRGHDGLRAAPVPTPSTRCCGARRWRNSCPAPTTTHAAPTSWWCRAWA